MRVNVKNEFRLLFLKHILYRPEAESGRKRKGIKKQKKRENELE